MEKEDKVILYVYKIKIPATFETGIQLLYVSYYLFSTYTFLPSTPLPFHLPNIRQKSSAGQ